ncbi:IclR family transcriptional regulator [Methylobacterium sp. J-030]|uniref:IclR family transcriptional regulator n=1 Tax=Methylobacterium sp. J-030 TaxID=2836627 RepID=UPI001FB8ED2B|nr:IclR family transcriptional regulator [Methylobacterium sp. J-030]MCJ2070811.1 IclR family transcriptional regulator [Methylobacterium sp. J-030]
MSSDMGNLARRRGRPPGQHKIEALRKGGIELPRVDAVERALAILDAFSEDRVRLTLAEIAQRTQLYPSTVLRLAGSLSRFGYLHRDDNGQYRLGPTPLRLGQLYRQTFDLTDYVRPALARLSEATGETAAFYVRDGDKRICLYRHHAPRMIRHHLEEGAQLPLDRGAGGRVLLAYTGATDPDSVAIRERGLAISLGERDLETAAIATAVHGNHGIFLGALGIVGLRSRFAGERIDLLSASLRAEASSLTRLLSGR